MKKRIHTLFTMLLLGSLAFSQQPFEVAVSGNPQDITVRITELLSSIEIEGISGSKIKVEADGYRGIPDKAKGLKPLSASPDNTDLGLSIVQDGNTITISMANSESKEAEYTIYLPKALNVYIDYSSPFAGDVKISRMAGEVEVQTLSGDLDLFDVTGPIVANAISSDINVTISDLSQASPTSINATSGDIDLSIPAKSKGTFKFHTLSGGVYTDLDFDLGEKEGTSLIMGNSSTGRLNGGGVEVKLNCISGDIYVRKR